MQLKHSENRCVPRVLAEHGGQNLVEVLKDKVEGHFGLRSSGRRLRLRSLLALLKLRKGMKKRIEDVE